MGASRLWGQNIVINEILASNQTGITDKDGDTSDWIELYNPSKESINLAGYTLTDKSDNPDKWTFPAVVMESEAYLLVWASGKDRVDSSELHTNFRLSASGEYAGVYDPGGELVDGFTFGSQRADVSYGRFPDGSDYFTTFQNPTPESANQEELTLSFSHSEGIYQNDIAVELQTNSETG
ncbi:lamin tail domain-containing protein, partial [bacterium]